MNQIQHHIDPEMLADYSNGQLDYATSLVVASHISLCDTCRAEIEAENVLGGAILQNEEAAMPSAGLEDAIMGAIHSRVEPARPKASGPLPQPVMEALNGAAPAWKSLGPGIKQHIIARDKKSSVRLIWIDGGTPVPEHSHKGQELTLVLQGAFVDETGEFNVGDVEAADHDLEHQPIAKEGEPCICLSSTSDNLIFKSFLPRLVQPIFQI